MTHKQALIAVALLAFAAAPGMAAPLTLTPDNALVVRFTTDPSIWGSTEPDYMLAMLKTPGAFNPPSNLQSLTAKLYNGNTLLGTYVSPYTDIIGPFGGIYLGEWISSTSPNPGWAFGQATPIDFTSILNGSIDGRIVVTINSGSLQIDYPFTGDPVWQWVELTHSLTNNSGIPVGFASNISVALIPEPATASTAVLSFAILALLLRRQARSRTEQTQR